MRSATTAQATALTAKYYTAGLRVLIADADGNLRDWSSQAGVNWIVSVEIDLDIDQPVSGATVTLRRDAGATLSLSPLRTDSTLNRNNANAFAPAIDDGRLIIVQVATVTANTVPGTSDFIELFRGNIDRVTFAEGVMPLLVRDIGNVNADRFVKTKTVYGTDSGVPLEDVAQALITDWGDGATLYLPDGSPSFDITTFEQQAEQSVVDAVLAVAQVPGWAARTVWNPTAGAFQFAVVDPQRTKSTPDQTIPPSRILAVRDLFIDRTNIRNDFTLNYTDASAGPTSMALSDGASQAKYGYRWMGITESSTSPINTATEALAMLTAIRADLKDPKAEQEIEMRFDWRIELGDLLQFQADGQHFDTDQTGAVVSVKHVLTPTSYRTTVRTRGAPAGQYLNWRERGVGTPLTSGPNLAVSAKQSGTNYVITWSGDRVQLSTDGGTTWATPGTSPITVAMNAPGGASKTYTFKGYRDGVATSVVVTIPAQSGSTAPSLQLTPAIASTQVDDSSSSVTLTLSAQNLPTPYAWTLYSGYTRGKRTSILDSGSQTSNPLSGNPTVAVVPQAKLFTWCTLVVTIGADEYSTDLVVNPYQPAFNTSGAIKRGQPLDDGSYAARATNNTGLTLHSGVTDARGAGYNLNRSYNLDQHSLDDVVDAPSGTYARVKASGLNAGRPTLLYRPTGAQTVDADVLAGAIGASGDNLVANGGGQTGALGAQASGWTATLGVAMVPTTADALVGDRSLLIDHSTTQQSSDHRQTFTLTAGHVYQFRGAIRQHGVSASPGGGGAWIRMYGPTASVGEFTLLDTQGDAGTSLASFSNQIAIGTVATGGTSDPWRRVQATFICNVTGTWTVSVILGVLVGTCNGQAYFDDVTLVEVPAATAIGAYRSYTNFSGIGLVAGGVSQNDSGGARPMMRGYQVQQLRHGDGVTFSPSYANAPKFRVTGGIKQDPRSVWGATGSGSPTETAAVSGTLPQIEDYGIDGLSASGGTVRARLRQPGTTTGHADAWSSTASGVGATTSSKSPTGTSNNDTYSVDGSTSLAMTYDPEVGGVQTVTMTLALDVDDAGTGSWIERATQTVTARGSSSTTVTPALNLSVVRSGLTASSKFRVRVKDISVNSAAGATGSATTAHLNYTTASGDQYANATKDTGVYVTVESWEGDSAV